MMFMGGNDFMEWFKAAGKGAAIQTFYAYGNGPHIAPQLKQAHRTPAAGHHTMNVTYIP